MWYGSEGKGRQDYTRIFSTQMSNQMAYSNYLICPLYLYCLKCIYNATGFVNMCFRNCSYTFCMHKQA